MNIKNNTYVLVILCIFTLLTCFSNSFAEATDTVDTVSENMETMPGDSDVSFESSEATATDTEMDYESEIIDTETDLNEESPDTDSMLSETYPDETQPVYEQDVQEEVVTPTEKVDSETGVYYTVKKGDTLWDLSHRFSNDAWKWPGMWSDNQQLTNPHLIYPGQRIKLFYRKDIEQIKKLEEKQLVEEEAVTSEAVEEIPEVIEPEETEKIVEAVEPVDIEETPETDMEKDSSIKLPYYHYSKIDGAGFMKKEPADPHGYLFKVKGVDKLMISKGDELYIEETGDIPLTPGAKYFCYRTLSPSDIVKNNNKSKKLFGLKKKVKKSLIGTQHYLTGVIEITGKKSGYAVGRVIKSYRTINLEDFLIPYEYRSPDITLAGSIEGISGTIITSEEHEGKFGDDKVAFIDKGTESGIKTGQMYNIFYPEEKASATLFGGEKLFIPVDFASFIVLHTETNASTILITSAYQGISPGDKWHYPQN